MQNLPFDLENRYSCLRETDALKRARDEIAADLAALLPTILAKTPRGEL